MKTISTKQPSTLKTYYDIAVALRGKDFEPAKFLKSKATKQGWDEEVIADERQMLYLIVNMGKGGEA